MLFNSLAFAVFYVVVLSVYWFLSHKQQNHWLLAASLFFYGWWDWRFLSLFLLTKSICYVAGLAIDRTKDEKARKTYLVTGVTLCLTILFFFKYFNFFIRSANLLFSAISLPVSMSTLTIILPLGISFYTFVSLSYIIDVYRGRLKAERNFLNVLLYVSFFPQLVAGPIERAVDLLPQVLTPRRLVFANFISGIELAAYGFFKKIAIADNLAPFVDKIFGSTTNATALDYILGTLLFALQIYTDFSGYTDIARGVARTLGFELVLNFRQPYMAANPIDFWERWHISLSTWFKDYLYFPLAMYYMRKGGGFLNRYKAHLIAMLLIGLWHGANIKFAIFGLYWGVAISVYSAWREYLDKIPLLVRIFINFCLVCFGWFFFRVENLKIAAQVFREFLMQTHLLVADPMLYTGIALGVLVLVADACIFVDPKLLTQKLVIKGVWLRSAVVAATFVGMFYFRNPSPQQFIYFQF